MNKIILALAAIMTMGFAACAQNKGEKNMQTENKPLVVYFSATGTTAKAARTIAEVTGGTLYEIVPQQAYTSDDLDWNDKQSRSSVEMNNNEQSTGSSGIERHETGCRCLRCHFHRLSHLVESGSANHQHIH